MCTRLHEYDQLLSRTSQVQHRLTDDTTGDMIPQYHPLTKLTNAQCNVSCPLKVLTPGDLVLIQPELRARPSKLRRTANNSWTVEQWLPGWVVMFQWMSWILLSTFLNTDSYLVDKRIFWMAHNHHTWHDIGQTTWPHHEFTTDTEWEVAVRGPCLYFLLPRTWRSPPKCWLED